MFRLLRYLKKYRKQAIIGPIFKFIEAVFELIVPLIMASIIDKGINGDGGMPYIFKMGGVLILLAVVGLASSLVCQTLASIASQGYGTVLRNELFKHISSLSAKDIDKFGTPTLITRITADVNQMQSAVAMLIRLVVRAPFLVIGATVMACIINWKIGLIFFGVALLIAFILYLIMSRSVPYYKKVQNNLDDVTLLSIENLNGARVIRAFSSEEVEEKRFNECCTDYTNAVIRVSKISSLLNPLTYLIINIGIILVLHFGGNLVNESLLSQGDITALVNYLSQILIALVVVANLVILFTKASASASRINEVLDTKPSIVYGEEDLQETNKPIIEFDDVSFNYNDSKNVLDNITFKINKGEKVGIIGGTGSGKSTIVNLIGRMYDCNDGSINLYGENVKKINKESLVKNISYVSQKNMLFKGTIRDNMKFRNPNVTDEEIWEALRVSQAKEFVEKLDDKLDSMVNQGGKNFSGGQRQRLCIARALINSPKILILDDASSALDFATDRNLRRDINAYSKDMTVIVISQRISTIANSDKIICLKDGMIDGIGTHEELLNESKEYQDIYRSQYKEEGEENA